MTLLLAVVASGLGALARYGLAGAVQRRTAGTRPWGTAVVNVTGAILLGVLAGLHAAGRVDMAAFTVVGAGFLGGVTTFSTWMVESVRLGEQGAAAGLLAVAVNVVGLLVAGLIGAGVGLWIAQA
ncbi:MAG: CrcB family protein [Nitriliruptoraceae bacterium]